MRRDLLFHARKGLHEMNEPNAMEILIVEDNAQDLEVMLRALRQANLSNRIQVIFGKAGLINATIDSRPKVILLDLKLPKVDGLEVLQLLKTDERTRNIPVVVLTSSKEESDVVESYRLGVNSYIVKPVSFEQFAAAVEKLGLYWLLVNQPPKMDG
jgi:CheY-like chemotaxis protein